MIVNYQSDTDIIQTRAGPKISTNHTIDFSFTSAGNELAISVGEKFPSGVFFLLANADNRCFIRRRCSAPVLIECVNRVC